MAGGTNQSQDLGLLSDLAVDRREKDFFRFFDFSEAVAELIDNEHTDTPLSIAINAPWGAGKTSVARMVQTRLEEWITEREGARRHIVCWFNAWIHDDAANVGAALAAAVARAVNRRRPWWRRIVEPLPPQMLLPFQRWRRRLMAGSVALALAAAAVTLARALGNQVSWMPAGWKEYAIGLGGAGVLAASVVTAWQKLLAFGESAARFVVAPASEAASGSMSEARQELGRLIHQATGDARLVIFIDDLERCRPPKALEVCEVATQILSQLGVVVVLVANMQAIATSAELKYADLEKSAEATAEGGRHYLEKMVQIQLDLPAPRPDQMRALLDRVGMAASGTAARPTPTDGMTAAAAAAPPPVATPALGARPGRGLLDRAIDVMGWKLLSGVVAVVIVLAAIPPFSAQVNNNHGDNPFALAYGLIIVVGGLLGLGVGSVTSSHRRTARQRLRTISEEVASKASSGTAVDELPSEVIKSVGSEAAAVVTKEVQSYLTNRSPELQAVEAAILRHLPALPREAKRMLNHARLLTRIARDRAMFGGPPGLTPEHLAKWIILGGRWPEVAAWVAASPRRMEQVEQVARGLAGNQPEGGEPMPDVANEDLRRLLYEEPPLGDLVERLIHFTPAEVSLPPAGPPLPHLLRPVRPPVPAPTPGG